MIGLHEGLEETRDRVGRHADAVVDHANDRITRFRHNGDTRSPSAGRELRCILQEVSHNLCDPGCICIDEDRRGREIA